MRKRRNTPCNIKHQKPYKEPQNEVFTIKNYTITEDFFYNLKLFDLFVQTAVTIFLTLKLFPFINNYLMLLILVLKFLFIFFVSKLLEEVSESIFDRIIVMYFLVEYFLYNLYIYFMSFVNLINAFEVIAICFKMCKENPFLNLKLDALAHSIFILFSIFLFLVINFRYVTFNCKSKENNIRNLEIITNIIVFILTISLAIHFYIFLKFNYPFLVLFGLSIYIFFTAILSNMLIRRVIKTENLRKQFYKSQIIKIILCILFINEMGLDFYSITLNHKSLHPLTFSAEFYFGMT
ncbi:hypothetical protein TUBRATIS_15810 [Tubulinosema ratisbonensis]|uniref:Uncharacterized protein n=1 Tax=Tubulinosema ratisbonensis TaxID=291195 RepID=A0A437ALD2_9MICR|nr:hypothetical protein TUBRATIS_15810 [Tubulinosema ratisbonensis]